MDGVDNGIVALLLVLSILAAKPSAIAGANLTFNEHIYLYLEHERQRQQLEVITLWLTLEQ